MQINFLIIVLILSMPTIAKENFIENFLQQHPQKFQHILNHAKQYRLQIIYTQVDRENNKIKLNHYFYRKEAEFYYPASAIKLPITVLALEKLNTINNIDKNTQVYIKANQHCQTQQYEDKTSPTGHANIGNFIEKALILSDNNAYNRLYEFLGQAYINQRLEQLGYQGIIFRRANPYCNYEDNKYTNAMTFYSKEPYQQPEQYNPKNYQHKQKNMQAGKGFIDDTGKYIEKPMDFSQFNYFPLFELHNTLIQIIFPQTNIISFNITSQDYNYLKKTLSTLPKNLSYPKNNYPDNFRKYLLLGNQRKLESYIDIYNKVGMAYGFLTDVAYIYDKKNNIEFFLSATIYVNSNEILNDGQYEYQSIGLPFMENLGRVFYQMELKR